MMYFMLNAGGRSGRQVQLGVLADAFLQFRAVRHHGGIGAGDGVNLLQGRWVKCEMGGGKCGP